MSNAGINEKNNVIDPELTNLDLDTNMVHAMINEAFYMFDEDHSNDIDKKEFKNLIRSINPDITNEKINVLMKSVDRDNSGKIDKEEFTLMMMKQFQNFQKEEVKGKKGEEQKSKNSQVTTNLELVFNLYDKDMDGLISSSDFVGSSNDLGDDRALDEEEGKILIDIAKMFWKKRPNYDDTEKDEPNSLTKNQFLYLLMKLEFVQDASILEKKREEEKKKQLVDKIKEKELKAKEEGDSQSKDSIVNKQENEEMAADTENGEGELLNLNSNKNYPPNQIEIK